MSFYPKIAKVYNTNQSRSMILCGNVHDLFWDDKNFVPLLPFLQSKMQSNFIVVIYELNAALRARPEDKEILRDAWVLWRSGLQKDILALKDMKDKTNLCETILKQFDSLWKGTEADPTLALEFMRQLAFCSRSVMKKSCFFIVEAADMILPAGSGDLAALNDNQMRRISIVCDWISEPAFSASNDAVLFVAESRSLIHQRIHRLPQIMSIEVPSPDLETRKLYLEKQGQSDVVAEATSGLSLQAISQLVKASNGAEITLADVIGKLEDYIQGQLGEDVVEFKKPTHTLKDCVGFSSLKNYLYNRFIPRMKAKKYGISGAAVAGPIGVGKTFIFEALATELDMPVMVLKNIRSQWFGQTDVIFERLRRCLNALSKVLIVIDEADTQFGGVSSDTHETERRLTGKVQSMMSDPALKGKVYWLLMTARIEMLSPDIRRPGRVGDIIISLFDPVDHDRSDFISWATEKVTLKTGSKEHLDAELMEKLPAEYSPASFTLLRNLLSYIGEFENIDAVLAEINDMLPPAISNTRRYQTLQAIANCTVRSLLPLEYQNDERRAKIENEIGLLKDFVK